MLSLIEKIRSGYLWDFHGGIHPPENKQQSTGMSLEHAPVPDELVLPVKQHIGKPGDICVKPGDQVLRGQALTECPLSFMLPIHAPTSGTVVAIEPRTAAHPSGLEELSVVIRPDGEDRWAEKNPVADYRNETPDYLIEVIRLAGISGMGGAGFPVAKKIQSGMAKTKILIINAAECEPYITADDMLMREHADEIIEGIEIIQEILNPELTIIAVEDNKPEAIRALELAATRKDLVIRVIPTKYPSGGEKQLIRILTNMEVPKNGIPADIGVLVQNVGSVQAVKRAVIDGEPLTERVVTLTGDRFTQPRNVWARIGTPVQSLLDNYGYKAERRHPRLIMGGPMMGFTLPDARVPLTKTSNCILAPARKELPSQRYEMDCIRCSQCAEACPASLLPQQLQWYAKDGDYDKCEELNLKDCIECGACAYVCPSEIPLVEYYRKAKAEIRTRQQESEAAERAKARFEEKKARLERDKAERENRFKKAADQRRQEMASSGDGDAVAAAIQRVKAMKADKDSGPKPAVAAAIARAKAKQAEAAKGNAAVPDNSEMAKLREQRKEEARRRKAERAAQAGNAEESADDKKAAVSAAIERAKARKAAQQQTASDSDNSEQPEDKKAAVAAAIARAKARKAAQQQSEPEPEAPAEAADTPEDGKKAAVAAAIARAKARKAAQQQADSEPETPAEAADAPEDGKKAAVAAAIARAKARKAAQQQADSESESAAEAADTPEDSKKAAVAAAVARAKARKAAQQQADSEPEAPAETADAPEDGKKAAVAAAIARAKARKAAQQQADSEPEAAAETQSEPQDDKKAAVAAAVARAKARKAAQQQAKSEPEPESEPTPEQQDEPQAAAQDDKKAAVAAAIARAKARKAAQQQKQSKENE